jgi:predicted membrane protein
MAWRQTMNPQDYGKEFSERLKKDIEARIGSDVKRPKVMIAGDVRWGFLTGFVVMLVGVALLLHHMGLIPFDPVARFWPLLLIFFGIMNLLSNSGRFFGFLLILAGTFLQLNKLGITHLSFAELWPLAIIAVGLLLMWGSLETRGFLRAKAKALGEIHATLSGSTSAGPENTLNAVAVFGGCERRVTSKNFQGGKVTAVFGGVELDFRDADIVGEAVLEINCVFGGVEIRVPETWNVHSRSVPVFGGYEDKSRQPSMPPGETPKTLVIIGMVTFAGVEISN